MLIRPANPVVARLLVITARTDLARYAYLRVVMDRTTVGVVLDRRMGERRWRQKRVAAERRRLDRRQQDLTEDLRRSGWAMGSRPWRSGCSCSWSEPPRYSCSPGPTITARHPGRSRRKNYGTVTEGGGGTENG